jgi:4a-hydroxytetrahydrobiopterin dehydratase
MHNRLNSTEIETGLKKLDGWILDAHKASIRKEWEFDSFKTAMRFFARVGELAETHHHHPEFLSNYLKMRIRLMTHDAHGLTNQDFELALRIDQLIRDEFSNMLRKA